MMQNTSIIYHIESVLEMQLFCLLMIYFQPKNAQDNHPPNQTSKEILYILILEHVFAYCSYYFRQWEIENYGELDINGVFRA